MFTDLVGYTALGQKHESLSLALVEEQRNLIRPILKRHDGREVKTIGDAFLVEFSSALDAIRGAYDIQRAARELNISLPEESRVHLRIGVHLGDVLESHGDISGDAVNVASRINHLAEDDGVCVTRQVYDHVHNKFDLPLKSLGLKTLKNVTNPLEIYKMEMPWDDQRPPQTGQLDKTRIAVLPLANISPDPKDEYFADGLTEELIARLSEVSTLKVIARTSVMNYKRKEKSIREIGRELGVSSVIEGSVRKADNRIRATIQLINSVTEEHLWSSSYDREVDDIFSLQAEIADKVVKALVADGSIKTTREPNHDGLAYTILMRANQLLHGEASNKETNLREALALFEQALSREPKFARAYAGIARAWFQLANNGYEQFSVLKDRAYPAAVKSVELGPDEADTHLAMAQIFMAQDKFESVRSELQKALRLNPSLAEAYLWLGNVQMNLDTPAVAIKSFESSLDLDPLSLDSLGDLVLACQVLGRNARALEVLQRANQLYPKSWRPLQLLARYYVWNKDYANAQRYLDKALELGAGEPQAERLRLGLQGLLYALTGRRKEAKDTISYLEKVEKEEARLQDILPIATILGDLDQAFACLMRLADTGAWWSGVEYLDHYSTLRKDPRYLEFCRKVGIRPYNPVVSS